MRLSSRFYRKFRLLLVATLVMLALAASPGLAGKFTLLRKGTEQCLVTPNPVSNDVAGQYTIVCSGFWPGITVDIFVAGPTGTTILITQADSSGSFSYADWAPFLGDGTNTVSVYQMGDRRMTVLASCSFQVL